MYIPDPFIQRVETQRVELEPGIVINFGVPLEQNLIFPAKMYVPEEPHLFFVDSLKLEDILGTQYLISDVMVLLAHGGRRDGRWVYASGQGIPETVTSVNMHLQVLHGRPWIDFVVSCNKPGDSLADQIDIHYFDEYPDKEHNLLYAFDATLSTRPDFNIMFDKGDGTYFTCMEILDPLGAIRNIDKFAVAKRIKVIDNPVDIRLSPDLTAYQ